MKRKFLLCVNNEGFEASLEVRKLYEKLPKWSDDFRKRVKK